MTNDVSIEELQLVVARLAELLADPQPGLATWQAFLTKRMRELMALCVRAGLQP